jgi:glycosyltransferase involved in cell wall biosynthesis
VKSYTPDLGMAERPQAHLPIRICHLAMGDGWAGAEVQLATLLAALSKMPDFEVSAILFNEGRLTGELRGLGIRTEVICESRHNSILIIKQLMHYFQQHQFDILHTHKYKDNILGSLATSGKIRPRIRTIHGFPEPFGGFQAVKIGAYQILDNWVNRLLVDQILAVSFDLRSHLIKHFGADKVTCIHNAIDIEQIRVTRGAEELRKELGLDENEFLIGTMGRLMPVKGLESFLKAAHIIRRQKANVKFIIAGDGPLKDALQKQAREYGLGEVVLFLGHRNDSHNILELMDLFVLPSISEGIPMVLLEALALARPVIASRVGGIPEVIEHGVSGLLIAPGREDELAKTCIALMDDPDCARRLGAAGRQRVVEHFSASAMAKNVAEIYRSLSTMR